jgi:hypothetical protein
MQKHNEGGLDMEMKIVHVCSRRWTGIDQTM